MSFIDYGISIFSIITTCILLFSKVQSPHFQLNIHTLLYAVSTWPQFWPQYLWNPKRILLGGQSFLTTVLTTTTEKTGGISGEESSEYHRELWIKVLNGVKKVKKNSRIRLGSRCREFESPHSDHLPLQSLIQWLQREIFYFGVFFQNTRYFRNNRLIFFHSSAWVDGLSILLIAIQVQAWSFASTNRSFLG